MEDKTIETQVERLKESLNQMTYERDYFERLSSEKTEKLKKTERAFRKVNDKNENYEKFFRMLKNLMLDMLEID